MRTPPPTRKILIQLILPFLKFLLAIMRQQTPALLMGIGLMKLGGLGTVEAAAIRIDLGPSQILTDQTSRIPFVELNGTPIVGAASVEFLFKNEQFVTIVHK